MSKKQGSVKKSFEILKLILYALSIIVVLVGLVTTMSSEEYFKKVVIHQEFSGKVMERYVDTTNNNSEIICIEMDGEPFIIESAPWINLYEYTSIGDSISKTEGVGELVLVKGNISEIRIKFDTDSYARYFRKDRFKSKAKHDEEPLLLSSEIK